MFAPVAENGLLMTMLVCMRFYLGYYKPDLY
jgi:hypothetical protein